MQKLTIQFPADTSTQSLGRNGIFNTYAIEILPLQNKRIAISPIHSRGVGRCCIEIPANTETMLVISEYFARLALVDEIDVSYNNDDIGTELMEKVQSDIWLKLKAGKAGREKSIHEIKRLMSIAALRITAQSLLIKQFIALYDGLLDMVNKGRLTEADAEDDFEWLVISLQRLTEALSPSVYPNGLLKNIIDGTNKKERPRYFFCTITEVNGEYEYTCKFLMLTEPNECPDKALINIFKEFRCEGELEDENFVWYHDGLAAKNPTSREITEREFYVMREYLSVLRG